MSISITRLFFSSATLTAAQLPYKMAAISTITSSTVLIRMLPNCHASAISGSVPRVSKGVGANRAPRSAGSSPARAALLRGPPRCPPLWLAVALWATGGFLIGSAWYRHDGLGVLAVGVSVLIAAAAAAAVSMLGDLLPVEWIVSQVAIPAAGDPILVAPVHVAGLALLAGFWLVIRDIPIRSQRP